MTSASHQFANEEVHSDYQYPVGYAPRPVAEQMDVFQRFFPRLKSFDNHAATQSIPEGAEAIFLIPRWQEIAPIYYQAVEILFKRLVEQRTGMFMNQRNGQLGADLLRQSAKKVGLFQKLCEQQKGHSVLVVPAQFGFRHRGKSVRRARVVMGPGEVGLGAFEIGCMLLSHPDRLQHAHDLLIDCAGDEHSLDASDVYAGAPFYDFIDVSLDFSTSHVSNLLANYGIASAFFPLSVPA